MTTDAPDHFHPTIYQRTSSRSENMDKTLKEYATTMTNRAYTVTHDGQPHTLAIGEVLGSGGQSVVFSATWDGLQCACKVAPVDTKSRGCSLQAEYYSLRGMRDSISVPKPIALVSFLDRQFLVMERLDRSLADLLLENPSYFTYPVCMQVCHDVLVMLRGFHRKGLAYLDIKPNNFMIGFGERSGTLYCVDLGNVYKLNCVGKNVGTPLFNSAAAMNGDPIGVGDEMESLCYMVAHLMGDLPWAKHLVGGKYTPRMLQKVLNSKVVTLADQALFPEGDIMGRIMEEVDNIKAGIQKPEYNRYLLMIRPDTQYPWLPRTLDDFTDGKESTTLDTPDQHCVTLCPEREPTPPPLVEALARECETSGKSLEEVITGKLKGK